MGTLTRQLELPGTDLDLSTLEEWVRNFPEREVRRALEDIGAREALLEQARQDLEGWLTLFEKMAHPMPDVRHTTKPVDQATREANGRGVSVKRQAILQLLGRQPAHKFSVGEITENLVARGLMEKNDKRAEKALSVMLAAMIDRGEIHRPVRAHYKFGPRMGAKKADDSMGVQTP